MHVESFLKILLSVLKLREDVHGDLAFKAPFLHTTVSFSSGKTSRHVLRFVAAYLQA